MSDSNTPVAKAPKVKPKFSLERFVWVVSVSVIFSLIVGGLVEGRNKGVPLIAMLSAMFPTMHIFDLRDKRRRGEMSRADFLKKSLRSALAGLATFALLITPIFIWPENSFKMFMLWTAALLITMLSIQGLVALIKRKKRAGQSVSDKIV